MIRLHSFPGRGHACLLLAVSGLISSVPVLADPLAAASAPTAEIAPAPAPVLDAAPLAALDQEIEAGDEALLFEEIGEGEASYYGRELAGNRTASGERFDPLGLTAAHRTLPLGSKLRVTNLDNGKSVIVRINDRGPFKGDRVIDVSLGAAREISMVGAGTASVRLELMR